VDEVTLGIAIAGLAIASLNAGWTIYAQGMRDRSGLRLKDWPTTQVGNPPNNQWVFSIEAANVGRRPITIESGGLELPKARWLAFTAGYPLPARLQEGEKVTLWTEQQHLLSRLSLDAFPRRVIFNDSTGRRHSCRLSVRSKRWLRTELSDRTSDANKS
jgi:hypothetical protein